MRLAPDITTTERNEGGGGRTWNSAPAAFLSRGALEIQGEDRRKTFICPPSVPPKHIMVPYPATTVPFALPAPLNIYGSISGDGGAVELAAIWGAYQMRRWHRRSRKDGPAYLTSGLKLPGMTRTANFVKTMVWLNRFPWIPCLNVPRFMPRALPPPVGAAFLGARSDGF